MFYYASVLYRWLRAILFVVLSPVLEKNPVKSAHIDAPVVLSMSRCIVALFAWGMYWQIMKAGIVGWAEATLCIAIVYAVPILNALNDSSPEDVLSFGKAILERFGLGEIRKLGPIIPKDDHETKVDRSDEVVPRAEP